MSKDSDLYGEDIRLWSEAQSALLRSLSAGEAVADQVDWAHVVEEIEHSHGQHPEQQDEVARLTARLTAAEALVNELRSRLDDLSSKLGDAKVELATAQDEAGTANARARAAEAERAARQADGERGGRGGAGLVSGGRGEGRTRASSAFNRGVVRKGIGSLGHCLVAPGDD
jgi:septal ring factor EnvC (AmiA/AmiB activator)